MIKIPEFVKNLKPYKAGKPIDELAREKNLKRIVKLASNENPIGPSPKAVSTNMSFHPRDSGLCPTCALIIQTFPFVHQSFVVLQCRLVHHHTF